MTSELGRIREGQRSMWSPSTSTIRASSSRTDPGSRWLWEAAVPLDTRETIDDFFTGRRPRLEGYAPPTPRYRPGGG